MTHIVDSNYLSQRLKGVYRNCQQESLWCDGNLELLAMPLASIVGTRNVSPEGVRRTRKLSAILVDEGFCIVSGLAKGVDRVAHETALEMDGYTIAVMGTPVDECYPSEHQELKEQIALRGLVLSQFAPGTPVRRSNFPQRNVLMASLTTATFVVEASVDSGTKHQVKAAIRSQKPVAFLASLVDQSYPWVCEALESGFGFVIEEPEDARALLRRSKIQSAPSTSPVTQRHFDLFQQFADEFTVSTAATDTPSAEQEMEAASTPSGLKIIPKEDQAHLGLILPSKHPKPSWWEKVWNCFLGMMPHRKV